jgi:hypothetical protein
MLFLCHSFHIIHEKACMSSLFWNPPTCSYRRMIWLRKSCFSLYSLYWLRKKLPRINVHNFGYVYRQLCYIKLFDSASKTVQDDYWQIENAMLSSSCTVSYYIELPRFLQTLYKPAVPRGGGGKGVGTDSKAPVIHTTSMLYIVFAVYHVMHISVCVLFIHGMVLIWKCP